MLKSQKLQLEMSLLRKRVNEMSQSEEYKSEDLDKITQAYIDKESEYSAALIAEDTEYRATPTDDLDAEGKEQRGIESQISIARYFVAALNGTALDGAEAEYNAARRIEGADTQVPWEAFLSPKDRLETYAVTTSPNNAHVEQQDIVERVFANGAAAHLGVRMPGIPVGASDYPVLSNGVIPTNLSGSNDANENAGTLTANLLNPKRLSATYRFRYEDTYKFRRMEEALRTDLAGAMEEAMDEAIIAGDGTDPNVEGFLAALEDATASTVSTFTDYASARAKQVDGRYAHTEDDVKVVVGPQTYSHAAGIYQQGSGTSALSRLMAMVSPHIPEPDNNVQKAILCKRPGRAVAPMWPSIGLIRDSSSKARQGEVSITAIALWNFKVLDANAYAEDAFKLA